VIELKPKTNVRTALKGRVYYEHVETTGASPEMLRKAGVKVAKEFPDFEVWVTCGPWRPYDLGYRVDLENKVIALDFYSVRPGFEALDEAIKDIKQYLREKGVLRDGEAGGVSSA